MSGFDIIDGRPCLAGKPLTNFVPEVRSVFCRPGGRQPEELRIDYVVCGTSTPRTVAVQGARLRSLDFEARDFACRYEDSRGKSRQLINDYLRQQAAAIVERGACGTFLDAPGWHDVPSPAFAGTYLPGGRKVPTEYVVHSPEGKPYNPNNWVNCVFRPFMHRLHLEHPDIPELSPHELRHTRATLWIARGIDPYMVARLLGHSDLKMLTKIYDHTSTEMLRKALLENRQKAQKRNRNGFSSVFFRRYSQNCRIFAVRSFLLPRNTSKSYKTPCFRQNQGVLLAGTAIWKAVAASSISAHRR